MKKDILRAIVERVEDDAYYVAASDKTVRALYGPGDDYLRRLLRQGTIVNLLHCETDNDDNDTVRPALTVVEPDFLLDISSVATCFGGYGYGPLPYTIGRFQDRATSQAMLLGNLAGDILDAIIGNPHFSLPQVLAQSFRAEALAYCTCDDFDPETFKRDAARQAQNMKGAVEAMFLAGGEDRAVLEPSIISDRLGLQGRIDMMTTDCRLLVEQKSGRNIPLERGKGRWVEAHYVQVLLYQAVLKERYPQANIRPLLLYSRYPAAQGIVDAPFNNATLRQAITTRNRIVAGEYHIARHGFATLLPLLTVEHVYDTPQTDFFFQQYIAPRVAAAMTPIQSLPHIERTYVCRQLTFAYREQLAAKVGHSPEGRAAADLWRMPLQEKQQAGDILTGLTVHDTPDIDSLIMDMPDYGDQFQPNFRRGDMAWLYSYTHQPDARQALLFKCVIVSIHNRKLYLHLADSQRGRGVFAHPLWALEHAGTASATPAINCLRLFATAPQHTRQLLLGLQTPRFDTTRQLTRTYHKDYDHIILAQKQALDYYLLTGPPGTGKTSMALRYIVLEELTDTNASILLTAYTNRAVDEICAMLCDTHLDFLRIGSRGSCDPRYTHFLLDEALRHQPTLKAMKQKITQAHIIVATTATLLSRSQLLQARTFTLAAVDEASQILETGIIGLLAQNIRRFVLIGDHKQLPAVVQQQPQESLIIEPELNALGFQDCRESLFQRLLRQQAHDPRTHGTLQRQGRMHPDIARLSCQMFYPKENIQPVPLPHQKETTLNYTIPPQDQLDQLLATRRVIFLPAQPGKDNTTSPKASAAEADIAADICKRVARQYGDNFDPDRTIGIIVPYRNQITMIRRRLHTLQIPHADQISIDTVERYQGSQRDVIIYSFTATQAQQLDFLTANTFTENNITIDRKLNVAITRARRQLIITGHEPTLRANPLFATLIDKIQNNQPQIHAN